MNHINDVCVYILTVNPPVWGGTRLESEAGVPWQSEPNISTVSMAMLKLCPSGFIGSQKPGFRQCRHPQWSNRGLPISIIEGSTPVPSSMMVQQRFSIPIIEVSKPTTSSMILQQRFSIPIIEGFKPTTSL